MKCDDAWKARLPFRLGSDKTKLRLDFDASWCFRPHRQAVAAIAATEVVHPDGRGISHGVENAAEQTAAAGRRSDFRLNRLALEPACA
jgi:hypothetical protein